MAEANKNVNLFALFKKYTDKIIEEQGRSIEISRLLELEVAFLEFTIKTYPDNIDYVDNILESTTYLIKSNRQDKLTKESMDLLVKVLTIPLDTLSLKVLALSQFPELMTFMAPGAQKQVAFKIVQAVIKNKTGLYLDTREINDQLIGFIKPLIIADKEAEEEESYQLEEE